MLHPSARPSAAAGRFRTFGCMNRRGGQNIATHPVYTESNAGISNFGMGSIPVRFQVDPESICTDLGSIQIGLRSTSNRTGIEPRSKLDLPMLLSVYTGCVDISCPHLRFKHNPHTLFAANAAATFSLRTNAAFSFAAAAFFYSPSTAH